MDSLGRELAEGLLDDVTILEFEANTGESEIFQRRNVILRKVGQNSCGDSKGLVHLVSKSIDRPGRRSLDIIVGQSNSPVESPSRFDGSKFYLAGVEIEQQCLKPPETLTTGASQVKFV